jgi:protein-L-isoaspartate(D-aspartate) O-methyltransferase
MEIDLYENKRFEMVSSQIEPRGIHDPRLLNVLRRVPRHRFVPEEQQEMAYDDNALGIGSNQTISQPFIVAYMTNLLQLQGDETVLEIGTGSGYQAAVLANLASYVHTIERHESLAWKARQVLAELGYHNIFIHLGDGALGWAASAPYHGILVTAAAPAPPQPLLDQLDPHGGRLVLPVGERTGQVLQVWQRHGNEFSTTQEISVSFVPLRGKYGWSRDQWEDNAGGE